MSDCKRCGCPDCQRTWHAAYLWGVARRALIGAGCPIEDGCHVPTVLDDWLNAVTLAVRDRLAPAAGAEGDDSAPPPPPPDPEERQHTLGAVWAQINRRRPLAAAEAGRYVHVWTRGDPGLLGPSYLPPEVFRQLRGGVAFVGKVDNLVPPSLAYPDERSALVAVGAALERAAALEREAEAQAGPPRRVPVALAPLAPLEGDEAATRQPVPPGPAALDTLTVLVCPVLPPGEARLRRRE